MSTTPTARSETRHTEEPWGVSPMYESGTSRSIDLRGRNFIASLTVILPNDLGIEDELCEQRLRQNANRIAACVNGCVGVANPLALVDVLEACETALPALEWARTHTQGNEVHFAAVVLFIELALAKARGGAPGGEGGGNG